MSDGTVIMSALADMEVVAAYRQISWAHKSYDTYASLCKAQLFIRGNGSP
jgi:hypothetical protein